MTTIVVDASVAFAWTFATQQTTAADGLKTIANAHFISPFFFTYEFLNGLLKAQRQRRITQEGSNTALRVLGGLIELEEPPDESVFNNTLMLAQLHGLTLYDATYLELALRLGATLATRDNALIVASPRAGVTLYDAS